MLPPTYCTCLEVYDYATPADVLAAAARDLAAVEPQAIVDERRRLPVDPRPARALGEDVAARRPMTRAGTAATSASAPAACSPPTRASMTLDGTNTWVLREPGATRSVVVDPGPVDRGAPRRGRVAAPVTSAVVLLTHGHLDHSEAARAFARADRLRRAGARPGVPARRRGPRDGDVVDVDGLELHVVGTPGHTADSLSFVLPQDGALLTGDTVLGRGTTVVAHPDGQLGAYLDSLAGCTRSPRRRRSTAVWPGHGPVLDDALGALDFYLAHRRERLEQVREALRVAGGPAVDRRSPRTTLPRRVVEAVYADVDAVAVGRRRAQRPRAAGLPARLR